MKKPVWIRFFGWAFWFCIPVWFVAVETTNVKAPQLGNAVIIWLAELAGAAALFMWVMGSIVFTFQKKNAEMQANAIAEGIRRAKAAGVTPTPEGPRRVMTSPLGLTGEGRK